MFAAVVVDAKSWQVAAIGTVAINFPPIVVLNECHCSVLGQQASPGKQRQLLEGVGADIPSKELTATIEGSKPIMLAKSEVIMEIGDRKLLPR